jgi:hypothetical protein
LSEHHQHSWTVVNVEGQPGAPADSLFVLAQKEQLGFNTFYSTYSMYCLSSLSLSCPALPCHPSRLFAVGYAARQVSSRTQLERLLSNSPAAAAGLGLHPADWALLGQSKVVCAHCSEEVAQVGRRARFACCCCWSA